MKKLFLIIATTVMVSTAWAQSQIQTVKGKTKDGKSLTVQYYKGTMQDYIESVEFQLVDELKADNKNKQNSINDLQYQLNKANKTIDNLNTQLKKSGNSSEQVDALNNQLEQKEGEINQLNEQLDELRAQLNKMKAENTKLQTELDSVKAANLLLGLKKDRPAKQKHPVIGVEASMGSVLLSSNSLNNPWEKTLSWNKQAAIYFGTDRFAEAVPLSFEIGIGFRSLPLSAVIDKYEASDYLQPDCDGDIHRPDYVFDNYTEKLTMSCLEVPVRFCIGQPSKDKVSVYAKIGVTPSFILSAKLANGVYTKQGYYPKWHVTLENIEELGFFNNGGEGKIAVTPDRRFNLWANASLGAYIPLNSSLLFNVGAKLDYPILKTSSFKSESSATDKLPLPDGLLKYDSRLFIPNLQAGLVYTLR